MLQNEHWKRFQFSKWSWSWNTSFCVSLRTTKIAIDCAYFQSSLVTSRSPRTLKRHRKLPVYTGSWSLDRLLGHTVQRPRRILPDCVTVSQVCTMQSKGRGSASAILLPKKSRVEASIFQGISMKDRPSKQKAKYQMRSSTGSGHEMGRWQERVVGPAQCYSAMPRSTHSRILDLWDFSGV